MFRTSFCLFAICFAVSTSGLFSNPAHATEVEDFRQWMVGRMASWAPPGRSFIKGAKETPDDGIRRYGEIVDADLAVAFDPSERPLFNGRFARVRTAALLMSIALHESGFRKDVDLNIGDQARGDGGRSWCMMQIQLGAPLNGRTAKRVVLTPDGYEFTYEPGQGLGGEDLIADRKACFRVGLRFVRRSFNACRNLPILERLSVYTSGNCNDGRDSSRARVGRAASWVNDYPPPMDDASLKAFLAVPSPESVEPGLPKVSLMPAVFRSN